MAKDGWVPKRDKRKEKGTGVEMMDERDKKETKTALNQQKAGLYDSCFQTCPFSPWNFFFADVECYTKPSDRQHTIYVCGQIRVMVCVHVCMGARGSGELEMPQFGSRKEMTEK